MYLQNDFYLKFAKENGKHVKLKSKLQHESYELYVTVFCSDIVDYSLKMAVKGTGKGRKGRSGQLLNIAKKISIFLIEKYFSKCYVLNLVLND